MLHHTYYAWKRDADVEYVGTFKLLLSNCMGGINLTDPANIRKAHEELMIQIRTKAIHTSNKYKIQVEPIQ